MRNLLEVYAKPINAMERVLKENLGSLILFLIGSIFILIKKRTVFISHSFFDALFG